MKNKDIGNKGSKKIDEVKNKDLMELISELKKSNFDNGKSLMAFPADEIEGLSMREMIMRYNEGKFSSNILDGFRKKVFAERDSLIQEVTSYYTSKLDFTETGLSMSPEEIVQIVEQKKIRLKRLSMVFEPDFYQTITRKSNGDEYDLVKLNWINDDGLKYIKISKTFGLKGKLGLEFSMKKVIRDYLMSVTEQEITNWRDEVRFPSGFIADQVVSIDGKIWVMEYKLNDKNDFIKTALRFELWDYYGQAYLRPEKSSKIFDG